MRAQLAILVLACVAAASAAEGVEPLLAGVEIRARPPLSHAELSQIAHAIRRATRDRITDIDRIQLEHGPDVVDVVTLSRAGSNGFRLEKRAGLWRIVSRGKIVP